MRSNSTTMMVLGGSNIAARARDYCRYCTYARILASDFMDPFPFNGELGGCTLWRKPTVASCARRSEEILRLPPFNQHICLLEKQDDRLVKSAVQMMINTAMKSLKKRDSWNKAGKDPNQPAKAETKVKDPNQPAKAEKKSSTVVCDYDDWDREILSHLRMMKKSIQAFDFPSLVQFVPEECPSPSLYLISTIQAFFTYGLFMQRPSPWI